MNWLIESAKEKQRHIHLPESLAAELVDAAHNQVPMLHNFGIASSYFSWQFSIRLLIISANYKFCLA